jgi:hypothetical protein
LSIFIVNDEVKQLVVVPLFGTFSLVIVPLLNY